MEMQIINSVIVLAMIVAIRTFLSWSLHSKSMGVGRGKQKLDRTSPPHAAEPRGAEIYPAQTGLQSSDLVIELQQTRPYDACDVVDQLALSRWDA